MRQSNLTTPILMFFSFSADASCSMIDVLPEEGGPATVISFVVVPPLVLQSDTFHV